MTKIKRKGEEGTAVEYMTRNRALKKLQLNFKDFRRLCILKGIYPRDPRHKNKVGSSATNKKAVYLVKDIQFLSHEPLLLKFRELKSFHRRLKKYMGKGEWSKVKSLEQHVKPDIKLDHLVRERYPSFVDALRDLDDPLSMLALFATLPRTGVPAHQADTAAKCFRLMREFEAYVVASGSLRKSFISIKGIYYQAEILGQTVTWVTPHEFATTIPTEVDFDVMLTFLEFYTTLVRFVNFRLFARLGWAYPGTFAHATDGVDAVDSGILLKSAYPEVMNPDELFPEGDHRIMHGCKVFISRECPLKSLAFVLQSLGADISYAHQQDNVAVMPFTEDDTSVTHQIVDRPAVNRIFVDRQYMQPQWIFDSLNSGKLLELEEYRIGSTLPAHMSPFVTDAPESDDEEEDEDEEEAVLEDKSIEITVVDGAKPTTGKSVSSKKEKKAQKELAISMLSKKRQKLYSQMQYSRQKSSEEKKKLAVKRQKINPHKTGKPKDF